MPPPLTAEWVGLPAKQEVLDRAKGERFAFVQGLAAGRGCSNLKGKARVPNQRTKKQKEVSLQTERTNKIKRAAKRKERDTKDMS